MSSTTPGGSRRRAQPDGDTVEVGLADGPHDGISVRMARAARPPSGPRGFTRRQAEVLDLVGRGLANSEIAEALGISRRTVDKHLEAIHLKAGTSSRARLVVYAWRRIGDDRRDADTGSLRT